MSEEIVKVNVKVESLNRNSRGKIAVEVSVAELEALGFTRTVVKPGKPVDGEEYYYIDECGYCDSEVYGGDNEDDARWYMGNCYKTVAEAIKARDKQIATVKVLRRLRELESDWVADWDNGKQEKWSVLFNHNTENLSWFISCHIAYCPLGWYSTKEAWEQVIEELEQDVKLMMGVE